MREIMEILPKGKLEIYQFSQLTKSQTFNFSCYANASMPVMLENGDIIFIIYISKVTSYNKVVYI